MKCECKSPGLCPRYKREMGGRMYDICRGVNVDAGTAEQYRQLWLNQAGEQPTAVKCPHLGAAVKVDGDNKKQKCGTCPGEPLRQVFECAHPALAPHETTVVGCSACEYAPRAGGRRLLLKNDLSPGDVLVMTAALYSLHKANPGKFVTAVRTSADAFFEHSPYAAPPTSDMEEVQVHYPAINQSNERSVTFMGAYCEFLSDVLAVPCPLATNRPRVWLSKQERGWMDQVQEATGRKQKFWLIQCGHKSDYTAKFWGTESYQRVVDALRGKVLFVQVGATEHRHPSLRGALNLVGKTDLRQLVRLAWHAEGVVCGITMLQHLAAALEKPSVVLLGGREPATWYSYPRQQLLHTVGALPCCRSGGCWKSRVEKLGDGAEQDDSLCENPVLGAETVPRCMALIRPEEVVHHIERIITA